MGTVSAIFDPTRWREVEGFDFTDITYHRHIGPQPGCRRLGAGDLVDLPTVRIAFHRPRSATPSGRTPSTSSTGRWTMPG